MRKKQARKPAAAESQQLTLFSLFDAQSSENPLTQALPAGGQRHSHSRLRSLPKPSSWGSAFSENPTTTALYGRPQADSDLPKDRAPVQELARRVRDLLRDEPDTRLDNPRLNELAREVFGTAVGNARDGYDAAEAGMNLHIDGLDIDCDDVEPSIQKLLALTEYMPRQTRRDERQVELQQFSTPPAQAFVVLKAAGLRYGWYAGCAEGSGFGVRGVASALSLSRFIGMADGGTNNR